jgi:hypothetical protein
MNNNLHNPNINHTFVISNKNNATMTYKEIPTSNTIKTFSNSYITRIENTNILVYTDVRHGNESDHNVLRLPWIPVRTSLFLDNSTRAVKLPLFMCKLEGRCITTKCGAELIDVHSIPIKNSDTYVTLFLLKDEECNILPDIFDPISKHVMVINIDGDIYHLCVHKHLPESDFSLSDII